MGLNQIAVGIPTEVTYSEYIDTLCIESTLNKINRYSIFMGELLGYLREGVLDIRLDGPRRLN